MKANRFYTGTLLSHKAARASAFGSKPEAKSTEELYFIEQNTYVSVRIFENKMYKELRRNLSFALSRH